MDSNATPQGIAVTGATEWSCAVPGPATPSAGRRERFVAPTHRRLLGTPVPTGPAAPADRLLGNLRLSG